MADEAKTFDVYAQCTNHGARCGWKGQISVTMGPMMNVTSTPCPKCGGFAFMVRMAVFGNVLDLGDKFDRLVEQTNVQHGLTPQGSVLSELEAIRQRNDAVKACCVAGDVKCSFIDHDSALVCCIHDRPEILTADIDRLLELLDEAREEIRDQGKLIAKMSNERACSHCWHEKDAHGDNPRECYACARGPIDPKHGFDEIGFVSRNPEPLYSCLHAAKSPTRCAEGCHSERAMLDSRRCEHWATQIACSCK